MRALSVVSLLMPLLMAAQPKIARVVKKSPPLPQRVEAIIAAHPALQRAHLGIRVTDLDGKVVYERNPNSWFVPASNTKLYTTAMALTRLGPDYRMTTSVRAEAAPDSQGVLHGDLRLVGGADPTLSGRLYPYIKDSEPGNPIAGIEELADYLVKNGLRRVDGSVVGDDTAFEWEPFPDGWGIDDPLYEYGAPVSALTLNDNALLLTVAPGSAAGEPAAISLDPEVGQFTIVPGVTTIGEGIRGRIRVDRPSGSGELRVEGSIALGAQPFKMIVAADNPALFAAQALHEALSRRGVEIRQAPATRHREPDADPGPDYPVILASRQSRPLLEIVQVVNKVSQNLHAELLLREVSRQNRPFGSRAQGLADLRAFLEVEVGIGKNDINFEDGSGLSRLTLLTPEATTRLLAFMARSSVKEEWFASLPVGGQDGTLGKRFTGFRMARKVLAKTGSLSHVAALGGYLDHPRQGRLAFTVLLNNYNTDSVTTRKALDTLVMSLLE